MKKRLWSVIEHWLTIKIGVEIRCCLSLFLMLFYYCIYRLLGGTTQAEILHIAEMAGAAYLFGWVQALLHEEFDQMDDIGPRQWAVIAGTGAACGLAAWLLGWFGEDGTAVLLFAIYMAGCGLCTVWLCHIKRAIDARLLNDELRAFQQRNTATEEEQK